MFEECLDHGMPKAYRADFITHDLAALHDADSATPFIWVLRTHGTHIFWHEFPYLDTVFEHEERHFFVWAQGSLHKATDPASARALLTAAIRDEDAKPEAKPECLCSPTEYCAMCEPRLRITEGEQR